MGRYRIFNKTTKQEETAHGDSQEQLKNVYAMVGEDIDILEVLEESEPVQSVEQPQSVDGPNDESYQFDTLIQNPTIHTTEPVRSSSKPVFYEVGGTQLMMQDGILYNKQWVDAEDQESYRIMSKKTGKCINKEFKIIQVLTWVPVDNENTEEPVEEE